MFCVLEYLGLLFLLLCVRYLGSGADPFTCPGTILFIEYNRYWEYSPLGVNAPCLGRAPSTNLLLLLVNRGARLSGPPGASRAGTPGCGPRRHEASRGGLLLTRWARLSPGVTRVNPGQAAGVGRGVTTIGQAVNGGRPQPPPTYP